MYLDRNRLTTRATGAAMTALDRLVALLRPCEPMDERGGGRNSDEGFHIAGGAIIAGAIAAGVGAFVAKKLGLLQ